MDIGTLIRAARDHLATNPEFALEAATAALRWMARGRYYEITAGDVWQAMDYAVLAATPIGRVAPTRERIRALIDNRETDGFVREQMGRHFSSLSGG